jgi:ribonuclease P protein component
MPRKNSLTHAEFVRVEQAKFRRERGSLFILSFGVLTGQKTAEIKAACVVSKKTAPRAVERSLIKRRWRAAMSQSLAEIAPPAVLVFYAMRQAMTASYTDIRNDVTALVGRASERLRSS